jgi:hypothetical protein
MEQDPLLITVNAALAVKRESEKRGFHPFNALAEGLRGRRARRTTIGLFKEAMKFADGESVDAAIASAVALPQKQREKALLSLQDSLRVTCSYLPFEYDHKVRSLLAGAEIFAGVAKMLPLDEAGCKISAPYQAAIRVFKDAVDKWDLRSKDNPDHAAAVLASVRALWELEYGVDTFWEGRLQDPVVRDYVITQLLEMPDPEMVQGHGWFSLRKNLGIVGKDVAESKSSQVVPFFEAVLSSSDAGFVRSAFEAAVFLEPIPQPVIDAANRLGASETPAIASAANQFMDVVILRQFAAQDGASQITAASGLAGLLGRGMAHIKPIVEKEGKKVAQMALTANGNEATRLACIRSLTEMAAVGVTPFNTTEFDAIAGPIADSSDQAAVGVFYNFTANVATKGQTRGVKEAAARAEAGRVSKKLATVLETAGMDQFEAAMEIATLFATGRVYLVRNGVVPDVISEMVSVIFEPGGEDEAEEAEQRRRAASVLTSIVQTGIGNGILLQSPIVPEVLAGMVGTILAPKGDSEEEKEELRHGAALVLIALGKAGFQTQITPSGPDGAYADGEEDAARAVQAAIDKYSEPAPDAGAEQPASGAGSAGGTDTGTEG